MAINSIALVVKNLRCVSERAGLASFRRERERGDLFPKLYPPLEQP
jgi:hypothetical protein